MTDLGHGLDAERQKGVKFLASLQLNTPGDLTSFSVRPHLVKNVIITPAAWQPLTKLSTHRLWWGTPDSNYNMGKF